MTAAPVRQTEKIYPVILSGGSGTRLWPMSRASLPKQLLPLVSSNSLLQDTVLRVSGDRFHPPIVLVNEEHRFIVAQQLGEIGVTPQAIVVEPQARNTAPAAAVAALYLMRHDPDARMLLMPADHVIGDEKAFLAAIDAAAAAADRLVTFGIVADRPETGYGYIRRGSALDGGRLYSISSFVEKPSIDKARQFLSSGDYTWNSGIFLMSSKTYWSEYENFHADSAAIVQAALSKAVIDPDFVRLDGESFSRAKNESIDYAVMEHTNKGAVVPVEMRWNDVGAWDALWDLAQKSAPGSNVQLGDVITIDCQNSYFRSEHGLLAAIGVEDLAVVVTPDAVLVAPKGQAQTVKRLVDEMKRLEREEVLLPATVYRPWGTYRSIHRGDNVQAKHITVRPGGKLSLQMHHRRAEHWVIVAGEARVTVESQELVLGPNQSIFIPKTARHRLENLGDVDVHLIEVQCGDYLGEDDIVRFDDIYGRTGPS